MSLHSQPGATKKTVYTHWEMPSKKVSFQKISVRVEFSLSMFSCVWHAKEIRHPLHPQLGLSHHPAILTGLAIHQLLEASNPITIPSKV